jgi:hypothetical protein
MNGVTKTALLLSCLFTLSAWAQTPSGQPAQRVSCVDLVVQGTGGEIDADSAAYDCKANGAYVMRCAVQAYNDSGRQILFHESAVLNCAQNGQQRVNCAMNIFRQLQGAVSFDQGIFYCGINSPQDIACAVKDPLAQTDFNQALANCSIARFQPAQLAQPAY